MSTTKQAGPPSNVVTGVIKAMRPRQWVKNLLVLAAPLAALGVDKEYDYKQVFIRVGIAFVVFSLAASSIYLVNDARDVEADRAHPTKRYRPIAAGVVPEWLAYVIAAVLAVVALGVSYFVVNPNLALVIAIYLAMQLAYCFGLKHQAVLDICIVSSAYLIRAIAGGAAAGIPLSQWFLLVMAFGSLFMAVSRSATRNCSSPNAPAPRSASRWRATPAATCGSSGRCRRPRWCSATACGRSSGTPPPAAPGTRCR